MILDAGKSLRDAVEDLSRWAPFYGITEEPIQSNIFLPPFTLGNKNTGLAEYYLALGKVAELDYLSYAGVVARSYSSRESMVVSPEILALYAHPNAYLLTVP